MPRLTTRDYKRPSRSASGARLKEFGLGVLVGVVLASAAFLVSGAHARHGAGARRQAAGKSASGAPRAPAADGASSDPASGAGAGGDGGGGGSGALPKPVSVQAPQYDFYRMLPRFKVPVPHDDEQRAHATPPPAAAPAARPATAGASYVLQVGSYRSSAEAEQIRARLARVGLSAQVRRIVEGSTTWNRVRIGPLTDAELARVRAQLRKANIHALVIHAGP